MVNIDTRFCINCRHYRPNDGESSGSCHNPHNIQAVAYADPVTGKPLIHPLYLLTYDYATSMRCTTGASCGIEGRWYEPLTLNEAISQVKEQQHGTDK